jgi:hypothetical protein
MPSRTGWALGEALAGWLGSETPAPSNLIDGSSCIMVRIRPATPSCVNHVIRIEDAVRDVLADFTC